MTAYLVRRLVGTIPVLLLISLLVFLLIHAAPGDPTLLLLGEETNSAEIAKAKENLGATIHVSVTGENDQHKTEACFKALGRALRSAIRIEGAAVASTKGVL